MKNNSTATSAAQSTDKASCEQNGGKWVSPGICQNPDIGRKPPVNKVIPAFFVPLDESASPQETPLSETVNSPSDEEKKCIEAGGKWVSPGICQKPDTK